MKTLTICGSMRYAEQMKEIAFNLERVYGYNILQCIYGDAELTVLEIVYIVEAHFRKIDLSDGIYIVDIDGYIGDAVKNEIDYAVKRNKEVIYHSKFIGDRENT